MPADTPPPEFLTTRELAALLRVRERKIYDLAAEGGIPCRRVTGKLLFPRREIEAWLETGDTGPAGERDDPPPVVAGSHDPLFDWALRSSESGIASFFDGSLDGLERVRAGQAAAATLHLRDTESEVYNVPQVRAALAGKPYVLLALARRRQGLLLSPPHDAAKGLADLAGTRLIPRQPKAGARLHLDRLLTAAKLSLAKFDCPDQPARTEAEAAAAVASGAADWAFGLEAVARQHGLAFRPVLDEAFDLLIHRRAYFEPGFQTLIRFIGSDAFAERARALGGYDVSERLAVRWNG